MKLSKLIGGISWLLLFTSVAGYAQTRKEINDFITKAIGEKNKITPKKLSSVEITQGGFASHSYRTSILLTQAVLEHFGAQNEVSLNLTPDLINLLAQSAVNAVADVLANGPRSKGALIKEFTKLNTFLDRALTEKDPTQLVLQAEGKALILETRVTILAGKSLAELKTAKSESEIDAKIAALKAGSEIKELLKLTIQLERRFNKLTQPAVQDALDQLIREINEKTKLAPPKQNRNDACTKPEGA